MSGPTQEKEPSESREDRRLFIGGLDPTVTEFQIKKAFQKFGEIAKVDFFWNRIGPLKGVPRDYCFVEYKDSDAREKAIAEMNNKKLNGRTISVKIPKSGPAIHEKTEHRTTKPTTQQPREQFKSRRDREAFQSTINSKVQPKRSNPGDAKQIDAIEKKLRELEDEGDHVQPSKRTKK
ncbi:hypothetical protein HDV05_000071 [Chytridiales sp. JEL 0842]|nr:hypothetical protein HDV05_000071 [Chytridiales sp. JEL 0842]